MKLGNFQWAGAVGSSSCRQGYSADNCTSECYALRKEQGEEEGEGADEREGSRIACAGFTFRPRDT